MNEKMKMQINSCIRDLGRIKMSKCRKSCAVESQEREGRELCT